MVILLLLLSGNVETNPGPETPAECFTPADIKARSDLGIFHINVRSLLSKLNMIKIWIDSTNADIVVLSETWLKKILSMGEIFTLLATMSIMLIDKENVVEWPHMGSKTLLSDTQCTNLTSKSLNC